MFPEKNWNLSTVSYILKHYRVNGTIQIKARRRKRTGRCQQNILRVRHNPPNVISTRKNSRTTRIKRTTVQRILRTDLNLKVYKNAKN